MSNPNPFAGLPAPPAPPTVDLPDNLSPQVRAILDALPVDERSAMAAALSNPVEPSPPPVPESVQQQDVTIVDQLRAALASLTPEERAALGIGLNAPVSLGGNPTAHIDVSANPADAAAVHPDGIAGPGKRGGVVVGEPVVNTDDVERVALDEFGRSMAAA